MPSNKVEEGAGAGLAMKDILGGFRDRLRHHGREILLFGVVLGVGFLARFWGLAEHFTHTDDLGILEYIFPGLQRHDIFCVPRHLTNAPFQYLFTYFLVSPALDYRELLFWGRLPSCVAGCLALVMLVLFYRALNKKNPEQCFLAVAFVACSWENIAFAKQMHSYAIGVLAVTVLLFWLMIRIRKPSFGLGDAWATSLVLALASHMQYQVLLFVPAFYLALLAAHWKDPGGRIVLLKNLFLSGALYLVLILPMWFFFLKEQFRIFSGRMSWAFGLSGEYAFHGNASRSLAGQAGYLMSFFLKNLYDIFESKMAFLPETAFLFKPLMIGSFSLFILGVVDFFISPDRKVKVLGGFFGAVLLTWWGMAVFRGFPYGPSRHTLILLPFFAVTAAQGVGGFCGLFHEETGKEIPERWRRLVPAVLGMVVLVFFLAFYGQFLKERKDPIDEKEIRAVLEAYDADEVCSDRRGSHLEYSKDYRAFGEKNAKKQLSEVRTLAFITRYSAESPRARCEKFRDAYNLAASRQFLKDGKYVPVRIRPCSDYYTVFEKNLESDVNEGFSRKVPAPILTNRFYFCILSLDPEKAKLAPRFGGKAPPFPDKE